MRHLSGLALTLLMSASACSQAPEQSADSIARPSSRPDLYLCDGCDEAIERAPKNLTWRVALLPDGEPGERLVLSGRVFLPDGATPAPGIVLYVHHTNAEGLYRSVRSTSRGGPEDGMIEGWLVTDSDGRYEVDTIRPAPYPDGGMPAHIHVYVKEPERRPYYIDDVEFEGDPHLTPAYRAEKELRGGSGIISLSQDPDRVWRGTRDIVLEW